MLESVKFVLTIVGVVIAGLIAISPILLLHANARRMSRKAAATVASELGLEFIERVSAEWLAQFAGVLPFGLGRNRSACNVMQGVWNGLDVILLEHRFVVGNHYSRKYVWQEIVVFPHSVPKLPDFRLVPASLLHKLQHLFTRGSTISLGDSVTASRFSQHYELTGSDSERIAQVFNDDVQAFFIDHGDQHLEISRGRVFFWMPEWRGEFGWRSAHDYHRMLETVEPTIKMLVLTATSK